MAGIKKVVKCVGRFSLLRQHLFDEVVSVILEDRTTVTSQELSDIWEFFSEDRFQVEHPTDPYYGSRTDTLRAHPKLDYLSLIPLFPSHYHLSDDLVEKYALSMGTKADVAKRLASMANHPEHFFQGLGRDLSNLVLPNSKGSNLSGYTISGNSGIGTISSGGPKGGGVRSDSPFLLEVYKRLENGEQDLAALIGFWAQGNAEATDLIVSQMQPCKNAKLPGNVPFGVGALYIVEAAARLMNVDRVLAYSAKSHPIFSEHPRDWAQFGSEFVCMWDGSAKKLGFDGSRNAHYIKDLRSK